MLGYIKETLLNMALAQVGNSVLNPKFSGIGTVDSLTWRSGHLHAEVRLEGLANIPIGIDCGKISIAVDGSSVTLDDITSNMPFMESALRIFVEGKPLSLPAGVARTALVAAKKALGL